VEEKVGSCVGSNVGHRVVLSGSIVVVSLHVSDVICKEVGEFIGTWSSRMVVTEGRMEKDSPVNAVGFNVFEVFDGIEVGSKILEK